MRPEVKEQLQKQVKNLSKSVFWYNIFGIDVWINQQWIEDGEYKFEVRLEILQEKDNFLFLCIL